MDALIYVAHHLRPDVADERTAGALLLVLCRLSGQNPPPRVNWFRHCSSQIILELMAVPPLGDGTACLPTPRKESRPR